MTLQVRGRRMLHALSVVLPYVGPAILVAFVIGTTVGQPTFAVDFQFTFWPAARDVLAGTSPYPHVDAALIDNPYVYPPLLAIMLIPFGLMPFGLAAGIYTALIIATVLITLHLCGVRDTRAYAVAFAWPAILGTLQTGAISTMLALCIAIMWKWRDNWRVAGIVLGLGIALKLVLAPVVWWLIVTGRLRAAALATASAILFVFVPWAAVGWVGLSDYMPVLSRLSDLHEPLGYSPAAVMHALGVAGAARAVSLVLTLLLVAATTLVARRDPRDGDRRSLALVILAALVLSPVTWMHYFALLLVPVALARPRFGPLWLLPAVPLVTIPPQGSEGELWRLFVCLGAWYGTLAIASLPRRAGDLGDRETEPYTRAVPTGVPNGIGSQA